jgi:hypothetical protein
MKFDQRPMAQVGAECTSEFDTYYGVKRLSADLRQAKKAWLKYQSTRGDDAVYGYLAAIFEVMLRWLESPVSDDAFVTKLAQYKIIPERLKREPGAVLIYCTSDARIVTKQTRGKWAHTLLYALVNISDDDTLESFIKRNGGINACAELYADTIGDWAYGPGW